MQAARQIRLLLSEVSFIATGAERVEEIPETSTEKSLHKPPLGTIQAHR